MLHVYLLYTTFGQTDRSTVALIKYAYGVFIIIIFIQFIVMCTHLSVIKKRKKKKKKKK